MMRDDQHSHPTKISPDQAELGDSPGRLLLGRDTFVQARVDDMRTSLSW